MEISLSHSRRDSGVLIRRRSRRRRRHRCPWPPRRHRHRCTMVKDIKKRQIQNSHLIIYFPMSERTSKRSEACEQSEQSRARKQSSNWPSTDVWIPNSPGPQCDLGCRLYRRRRRRRRRRFRRFSRQTGANFFSGAGIELMMDFLTQHLVSIFLPPG